MQQPDVNAVNPDVVCQQALRARMATYEAKEHFETVLKGYNDQVAGLINLVGMMKARILELEAEQGKGAKPKGKPEAADVTK
jgi:hypothetical protein